MPLLLDIRYPQFSSSLLFGVGKTSSQNILVEHISLAFQILSALHLVNVVSSAYNFFTLVLLGLCGGCQTASQSFNHLFTSFGT
jgi:hypothetical protein